MKIGNTTQHLQSFKSFVHGEMLNDSPFFISFNGGGNCRGRGTIKLCMSFLRGGPGSSIVSSDLSVLFLVVEELSLLSPPLYCVSVSEFSVLRVILVCDFLFFKYSKISRCKKCDLLVISQLSRPPAGY